MSRNNRDAPVSRTREDSSSSRTRQGKKAKSDAEDSNTEVQATVTNNTQKTLPQMMDKRAPDDNKGVQELLLEKIEFLTTNMATKAYIDEKLAELAEQVKRDLKTEIQEEMKIELEEFCRSECQTVQNDVEILKGGLMETDTEQMKIKAKLNKLEKTNELMQERISGLELERVVLKRKANDLEQYTRMESIRVYGLEDTESSETSEDCTVKLVNLLKNKLNMQITQSDISIAHRLGKHSDKYTRPVICKFVTRKFKQEAIRKRRALKGSAVIIREDLTTENQKRLEFVSSQKDVLSAWTTDGRILAKLTNDRIIEVRPDTDIGNLTMCSYLTTYRRGYGRGGRGYVPQHGGGLKSRPGGAEGPLPVSEPPVVIEAGSDDDVCDADDSEEQV